MKKTPLPTPLPDPSRWGKWLLSAGLLLIAVPGFFQLYEVQEFFFPGTYQTTEIKLMGKECSKVEANLQKVVVMVREIQDQSSPDKQARLLHAAKKKLVYVMRRLKFIDAKLNSLQQAIQRQRASVAGAKVGQKQEMAKNLIKIRELQASSHLYHREIDQLAVTLNQLSGGKIS